MTNKISRGNKKLKEQVSMLILFRYHSWENMPNSNKTELSLVFLLTHIALSTDNSVFRLEAICSFSPFYRSLFSIVWGPCQSFFINSFIINDNSRLVPFQVIPFISLGEVLMLVSSLVLRNLIQTIGKMSICLSLVITEVKGPSGCLGTRIICISILCGRSCSMLPLSSKIPSKRS